MHPRFSYQHMVEVRGSYGGGHWLRENGPSFEGRRLYGALVGVVSVAIGICHTFFRLTDKLRLIIMRRRRQKHRCQGVNYIVIYIHCMY